MNNVKSTIICIPALLTGLAISTPVSAQEIESEAVYDSSGLTPSVGTWRRLLPGDEGLQDRGCFTETFSHDPSGNWLHTQTVQQDDGVRIQEIRTLNAESLRTIQLQRFYVALPEGTQGAPLWVGLDIEGSAATGEALMPGGQSGPVERTYSGPVRDGWIAGLLIATLDLQDGLVAQDRVAVPLQDQEYILTMTVTGRESYPAGEADAQDAWAVDADWYDLATGNTVAGGRTRPGGTYFIAVEPEAGRPAVLGYMSGSAEIRSGACR